MKKKDIEIGSTYLVKISGKLAPVRILQESIYGGWNGRNKTTGRDIRIKTAGRLRRKLSAAEVNKNN